MTLLTAAFFLGFLALTACERTETDTPNPSSQTFRISLVGAQPAEEDETRTEWTGSGLNWSVGDAIQLAYSLDGSWYQSLFTSDPLAEAASNASFSVTVSGSGAPGTYAFRSVYPSAAVSSYSAQSGTVQVIIPTQQTMVKPDGILSFDPAADLLWGSGDNTYNALPDGTSIPITWKREVAHAVITLKNLPSALSSETIRKVSVSAQAGAELAGSYSLILNNGELSAVSTSETIVLSADNLSISGGKMELWLVLAPVTVSNLTVSIETDQARYSRTIPDLNLTFLKNRRNTLGINMSSATRTEFAYCLVSETPDDWSGDYLLAYNGHVFAGKASNGNYATYTDDLTITNDRIAYSSGKAYNIKIAKRSSGNYSLQYDTQYIGYPGSGNYLSFSETPDNWDQFEWTISLSDDTALIKNAGSSENRLIQWNDNSGQYRFSCYKGTQKNPFLYRLNHEVEGGDPVTPPDPPIPPDPPTPSDKPGYLGCFEVPAVPTLTGQSTKGYNSDKDDNWYGYYTSESNRRVATHTFKHPDKGNRQTRNFTVMFDGNTKAPVWTAHAMHTDMWPDHNVGRNDSWKSDPAFDGLSQVNGVSGYSRGHLVASNYRQSSVSQNKQTFYLSNQAPQWQTSFNDGVWNSLEQAVQSNMPSGRDTLYVVIGVLYEGTTKYSDDVPIPSHFYKCLMKCSFDTAGNMTAANGIGYIFTNEAHKGMKYSEGATTIDAIEARAGFDFFPRVPESLQTAAEASTTQLW